MEQLNKGKIEKVCERLWVSRSSLKGLSGLFMQGTRSINLGDDEFFGIGQLLKRISEELEAVEDILRCGNETSLK